MKKLIFIIIAFIFINETSIAQWTIIDTLYAPSQCTIPTPYDVEPHFFTEDTAYYFYNTTSCSPGSGSGTSFQIFVTYDGLINWNSSFYFSNYGTRLYNLRVFSKDTAYFIGTSGGIKLFVKTINAGINWNILPNMIPDRNLVDLRIASPDSGFVIDYEGNIFQFINDSILTNDSIMSGAINPKLYFFNNYLGFARSMISTISNYNKVIRTNDGGITWDTIFYNPNINVREIEFCNTVIGFMATDSGLYKTTNGGTSWQFINSPFLYCPSISLINCNEIYAIGYNLSSQGVYKSNDGGNNWIQQNIPPNINPKKIKMINENVGYLYAVNDWSLSKNLILKTTNGGTFISSDYHDTKINIYPNPNKGYFSVLTTDENDWKDVKITIRNISGINVPYEIFIEPNNINIRILKNIPGLYFVDIMNKSDVIRKKVVID